MVRKNIIVHEQGVGFRYYVHQTARRIGIHSWVTEPAGFKRFEVRR
jgi:acylphosphatase